VCRTEPQPWNFRFQEFPNGPFETVHLTADEQRVKQSMADWLGTQRVEAAMAGRLF
jgi:hypothetical protein